MFNRTIVTDRIAQMLRQSREDAGLSQKEVAKALGKSLKTIQNWENGYGSPDGATQMEWFYVCGLNELPYLLVKNYPEMYKGLGYDSDAEVLKNAIIKYIDEISDPVEIHQLAFCMLGKTGSSWRQQLNMLTAHNHCTMRSRVSVARLIADNFAIEKIQGNLVCPNNVLPDLNALKAAMYKGKCAIEKGKDSYSDIVGK